MLNEHDASLEILSGGDAFNNAISLPIALVVKQLVDLLGATTVAEIGGVKETRAVAQWIGGEREPQRPHVLRFALQLALMIATVSTRELAKAWFHGSNPELGDASPLALLRDRSLEAAQVPLMVAVRSFASRNS